MTTNTTLTCGHEAETDAPTQFCERCGCEQTLAAPKPAYSPDTEFPFATAQTGYTLVRNKRTADEVALGEVTSHRARDSKGHACTAWKAVPFDGRETKVFRTRRAAGAYLAGQ
jgi:hypothetical protein